MLRYIRYPTQAAHRYLFSSCYPSSSARSFSSSKAEPEKKPGFIQRLVGPQTVIASSSFKNRYMMMLPAFLTHICIGSPWAWSVMSGTLTREIGFVTSAAADWTLGAAGLPLSLIFFSFGVTAALAGKWQMKVGTRATLALGALSFGGGLMVGSAGIALHQLWLLYLGYGLLGGIGIGLSYTPPIQALIEWFPEKKGLASGITVGGFGAGALLFAPLIQNIMKRFAVIPEYLGKMGDVSTSTVDGKLFAEFGIGLWRW
jgi:MFS family permease